MKSKIKLIIVFSFCSFVFFLPKNICRMKNIEDNPVNQSNNKNPKIEAVSDCNYTLASSLEGIVIPEDIKKNLRLVNVYYYSFDGKLHKGQLVINKNLVNDIKIVFKEIRKEKFPIAKVVPIVAYTWSDSASMADDNTSAFNYRVIKGTDRLSNHAFGIAIDINPKLNPQITKDAILPSNGSYRTAKAGTITENSFLVRLFKKLGWSWGGDWKSSKDYQHFEKKINWRN